MATVPDIEDGAMAPTALSEKLLTAEEFGRLASSDDGSHQELVRGAIVVSPPPKGPHGFSCSAVNGEIWSHLRDHPIGRVFGNDTGVVTETSPDTVRGPDVSYWSFERLPVIPEDDYIRVAPILRSRSFRQAIGPAKSCRRYASISPLGRRSSGSSARRIGALRYIERPKKAESCIRARY